MAETAAEFVQQALTDLAAISGAVTETAARLHVAAASPLLAGDETREVGAYLATTAEAIAAKAADAYCVLEGLAPTSRGIVRAERLSLPTPSAALIKQIQRICDEHGEEATTAAFLAIAFPLAPGDA